MVINSITNKKRGENGGRNIDLDEVLPLVCQNCRYCTDMTAEF